MGYSGASLDVTVFNAQSNLQPISDRPAFQSTQAHSDIIPAQCDRSPMPELVTGSAEPRNHHQSQQNQQTVLTMPTTSDLTFSFAIPPRPLLPSPSSQPEKTDTPRCAQCTKALCTKRHTCEGQIRRENCSCGHPQLRKGERRISEKEVQKRLTLQDSEIQMSR